MEALLFVACCPVQPCCSPCSYPCPLLHPCSSVGWDCSHPYFGASCLHPGLLDNCSAPCKKIQKIANIQNRADLKHIQHSSCSKCYSICTFVASVWRGKSAAHWCWDSCRGHFWSGLWLGCHQRARSGKEGSPHGRYGKLEHEKDEWKPTLTQESKRLYNSWFWQQLIYMARDEVTDLFPPHNKRSW